VTRAQPRASRASERVTNRVGPKALWVALVALPLACAYPLLEAEVEETEVVQSPSGQGSEGELAAVRASVFELADRLEPLGQAVAELAPTSSPEPEPPAPPPPPPPPTPEEIEALLADAAEALRDFEIKIDPRDRARGPLPEGSGLEQAWAEGRAIVLEGRIEQIRQWTALAKFGSREPGPHCGFTPLARYDLVVTRETRRNVDTAYLHIVVPAQGLPGPGELGTHEAWIGGERWVNLADALEPDRDYLPFKTNANESLHRQWAKAEVVEDLVEIATEYRQRTGLPLGIGDLSHVTGGKIEDHWTHQKGVDVDLYLLDPALHDDEGRPQVWWSHVKRGVASWTSEPKGKGEVELRLDPDDELSHTPTSKRLEVLAQIVFLVDEVAYFVHNDSLVLEPFDRQAGERRPGRRFLHAENRGFWPTHADHVHLRWVEGKLPVGVPPRP
jgi:hypothetical protein